MIKNLKKLAIRISMKINTPYNYLIGISISDLLDMAQEIAEINQEDEEMRKARMENN
ncbi:MAG: hypothetical protein ACLR03_04560 [Roseburia inulinivorans]